MRWLSQRRLAALEEKGTAIDHLAALGMAESNLYRLAKGIE
jgi:hypothetical protein